MYVYDPLLEDEECHVILNELPSILICTLISVLTLFELMKMQVC